MKRFSVISLIVSLLFILSCEDKVEKDTTPPEVTITSPTNGSTVSIIVSITCMSSDDKGVERVDLWVNGQPIGVSDTTEPYSMEWNTITYDDGSYGVTVRSYDTSGNTTDSDPITLTVVKTITFGNEDYSLEETTSIDCNDCGHNGDIPTEIGYMTNLKYLTIMNNNEITGNIPTEIGNLKNLITLEVINNVQLTVNIPSEIGNLKNLTKLEIINNNQQMSGEIPSEIGNLTNLERLVLVLNRYTGEIPSEIGYMTNLSSLQLNSNQLTGSIPSNIGNLTKLNTLSLQENQLSGEIPSEIGYMTNLSSLRLQDNLLSGEIPESICNLGIALSNGIINVRRNQLCPPYPSCLVSLNLIVPQDTTNCG